MPSQPSSISHLAVAGMQTHDRGRINEASAYYRELLVLDPPISPSPQHLIWILKFAPRLHTVAGEFFPLKDIVAVLHPDKPVIGYHLFWEDDIDYPDDNQPCDHEIIWVEFDPSSARVTKITAYLHGRLAEGLGAAEEANTHDGRPWIGIEWGKHGSLPWRATEQDEAFGILRRNWDKLHHAGRRCPDHPLAQGWPAKFEGDLAEYLNFSVPVDPRPLLDRNRFVFVSRWPNAVINLHCLRYNFSPKQEWPWLVSGDQ